MFIGNTEIPIVSTIEEIESNEVDEISPLGSYDGDVDRVAVKHDSSIKTLEFLCYLNEALHSQNLSLSKQKENLRELRKRKATENKINAYGYLGHLVIQEVSISDNAENSIVNEIGIVVKYFPWPKYYSDV